MTRLGRSSAFGPPLPLLLLAAAALLQPGRGQQQPVYFVVGGPLLLQPRPVAPAELSSVVWTHNRDLVVEWEGASPEYFGSFKLRSSLDLATGELRINDTTAKDAGDFRAEINKQSQDQVYRATPTRLLRQPVKVVVRTLSCSDTSEFCTLECQGDVTGAAPVTYRWRWDQGPWGLESVSNRTNITSSAQGSVKEIYCRIKNPVSEEESEPLPNPLFVAPTSHIVPVVVSVGVVGVGIVLGVVAFWKKEEINKFFGNKHETVPMNGP